VVLRGVLISIHTIHVVLGGVLISIHTIHVVLGGVQISIHTIQVVLGCYPIVFPISPLDTFKMLDFIHIILSGHLIAFICLNFVKFLLQIFKVIHGRLFPVLVLEVI